MIGSPSQSLVSNPSRPSVTETANKKPRLQPEQTNAAVSTHSEKSNPTSTRPKSSGHPLGIKPWGNYYLARCSDSPNSDTIASPLAFRSATLGPFRHWDDQMILDFLEKYLSTPELALIQRVSLGFYALARYDGLWRKLTIQDFQGEFCFDTTWRQTYRRCYLHQHNFSADQDTVIDTNLPCVNFYSDTLFNTWHLATQDLTPLDRRQRGKSIPRRACLSISEFIEQYERPGLPVILTDVVTQWPAYQKWTPEFFLKLYGSVKFQAEAVEITFDNYWRYATTQTLDEAPLYLFDKHFGDSCPELAADFQVPGYFSEDLFQVLTKPSPSSLSGSPAIRSGEPSCVGRPDYRWIIIGPQRSGSTFHKDPNATSAWNAVITGRKKWIMFPPECVPPGVFTNADQSEVTSPVSLIEWFQSYYQHVTPYTESSSRQSSGGHPCGKPSGSRKGAYEGVCQAGEVIFVPQGWWHCVLNLEDSIAITQNYVSRQNLTQVLDFLQYKRDQISGVPCHEATHFYERFCAAFDQAFPGELATFQYLRQRKREEAAAVKLQLGTTDPGEPSFSSSNGNQNNTPGSPSPLDTRNGKGGFWQTLTGNSEGGFQFGF
ncbi:hypothetical protein IWQ61_007679 [Dispira simplex]|nr:hypothetical protein IWQ61_007679 [Dispira simplex]